MGMLIVPQALKSLNRIEKIQPRMRVAAFNDNPSVTIISCYSLTNANEEITSMMSYPFSFRSIPKHKVLIFGGDMKAQIGKNGNHKFSLYNLSNRNGQHLIDFTIENRLTCNNWNFQKREGKLCTTGEERNTYSNDVYENFVNANLESAAEYIPAKQRTKSRVPWEILLVREKRSDRPDPINRWPSRLEMKNPPTARPHSTSALDMTLTIWCWDSNEAGSLGNTEFPIHCQVNTGPKW